MAIADPAAKIITTVTATPFANRSYLGCLVSIPRYSLVEAMSRIPAINAAWKMCDCASIAITTSLPIPGISMSPIGTVIYLLLRGTTGKVQDPDNREQHVDHHG